MRILLLSMDYPPRMAGGTTVHTERLAKGFAGLGHEVHVIASAAPGAPAEEDRDGIHVHRVGGAYSWASGRKARSLAGRFDVVHGHGTCTTGHLWMNRAHPTPTVVKLHNAWIDEVARYRDLPATIGHRFQLRLNLRFERYCLRRADHLICISESVRAGAGRYGIALPPVTVIHNGVDVERFAAAGAERETVRARWGLPDPVVLFVGRLERHKGPDLLLRALERRKMGLVFVGKGPLREDLAAQAKAAGMEDRVRFEGLVAHEALPELYRAADMFCAPSLYEPLGNVILEAMAAGAPIVAARRDGIPEILPDDAGILVEPTVAGIGDGLDQLAADSALRRRLAARAGELARTHSWTEVARRSAEILQQVVDRRRTAAP